MALEWSLEQIATTPSPQSFVPHFSPSQLDLILTGKDEGPVWELIDGGDHDCSPAIIPSWAVRRCADGLSRLSRSGYAPEETVLAGITAPVSAASLGCYRRPRGSVGR
jgi:hypothetical protein